MAMTRTEVRKQLTLTEIDKLCAEVFKKFGSQFSVLGVQRGEGKVVVEIQVEGQQEVVVQL